MKIWDKIRSLLYPKSEADALEEFIEKAVKKPEVLEEDSDGILMYRRVIKSAEDDGFFNYASRIREAHPIHGEEIIANINKPLPERMLELANELGRPIKEANSEREWPLIVTHGENIEDVKKRYEKELALDEERRKQRAAERKLSLTEKLKIRNFHKQEERMQTLFATIRDEKYESDNPLLVAKLKSGEEKEVMIAAEKIGCIYQAKQKTKSQESLANIIDRLDFTEKTGISKEDLAIIGKKRSDVIKALVATWKHSDILMKEAGISANDISNIRREYNKKYMEDIRSSSNENINR